MANSSCVTRRALLVMRLTRQWRYIRLNRNSLITRLASAIAGLKATTGWRGAADGVGVGRRQRGDAAAGLGQHVDHQRVDHPADRLVAQPRRRHVQAGAPRGSRSASPTTGRCARSRRLEQPGAQAVIEIVAVIGDVVGQVGDLRLGRGEGARARAGGSRRIRRRRAAACAAGRCAWPGPRASPRSG